MSLVDFQDLVTSLVRDDSGEIAVADRDRAIDLAVIRYSTDRPQTVIEAVVSAGGVLLNLPASWDPDFSRLVKMEIPDGDNPTPISGETEQVLAGVQIRLDGSLAAAESVHIHFTQAHLVDAGSDTVPFKDREAVASWAAALLLEQMATLYSGNRQPTLAADTVDWQSKGRDFASRAKRFRQLYLDHLGIDPKRTVAHGVVVDFDRDSSDGGRRINHSQLRR